MGIYQRNNGIYYYQIKNNGKNTRISLETKDKELAYRIYENYIVNKLENKLLCICDTPKEKAHQTESTKLRKTILTAFTEYIDLCISQNLSQGVIQSKNRLYELFKKNKIKYLDEINQKFLNSIISDFQKDTANRYIKNLKAFMNFCIKKRYYDRADFESLTFVRQDDNVRDVVICENDYEKLITHTKDKDFELYLKTLWETGTRPNEITQLKKSDIDFKSGTAKIYQSKTKKYKTVYLTDELLSDFDKIQSEFIFSGHNKQKEYYSKKFRDLRDILNMNSEYCLYAFRHTFGTRMLNKTKDIHLVSKLLGHSDISITAKHYINRSDSEIREKLINL